VVNIYIPFLLVQKKNYFYKVLILIKSTSINAYKYYTYIYFAPLYCNKLCISFSY